MLWFVQEIDGFVQEFLSVVNRLPSCIWTLQALAKRPVPADLEHLQEFCCVNQTRFQQLRRYCSEPHQTQGFTGATAHKADLALKPGV